MFNVKKLLALALSGAACFTFAFGFAACNGSEGSEKTEQSGSATESGGTEQDGSTTDTEQSGTEQSSESSSESGDTEQDGSSTDTEQSGTEQSDGSSTEGGDTESEVTPAEVSSVTISGDAAAYIGYTATLMASVTMSDGSVYDGEMTWTSSDESIATVADGMVTGVAEGTADITAMAGGVASEAYTITVSKRPSDVVDAAGWVAVMTSTDIFNSMAVGTENYLYTYNYNTGEIKTETCVYNGANYFELTSTDDGVTGYALCTSTGNIDNGTDVTETSSHYYYIQEPTFMRCYHAETDDSWIYEDDYTGNMSMYVQLMFADESYFGGDYFNYDDEAGAYVWEYSSVYSTYRYEIVIIDGNVYSMAMYRNTNREYDTYTYTLNYSAVINYTYGGVTVDIPEDIKSELESLSVE